MAAAAQPQGIFQSSLYVGDLHPLASDALLQSKFAEIGPILSARVCRDLATRHSLGYGYVNFEDPKDAERALELMNYEPLMGRPIRIMWSQRDPSLRKSGRGNIFIKNLDKSIEQKELYDTFGCFGRILSCKIAMDENGISKGYGFVHFEKEECAERAIEKINGMIIRDRVVYVGKFIPKAERSSQARKLRFNNIYVKNFPPETDDQKLHEMFSEFGEIKSACVMKDADGKSKGFGFVCFLEPDHAENAVKVMHNKEINGRPLYATRAQRKEERQEELKQRLEKQRAERQSKYTPNVNLYVKNLDDSVDDATLKEAFSKYGVITSAKVMLDANNRSKGFGFVCFTHPDQATRAVTEMNGILLGAKPLYVAIAQRKEDRRAKLLAEHEQRITQFRNSMNPMLPAVAPHPAGSTYFPPAAFPQPQRFYHPTGAVLGSQPRWSRATGMAAGLPPQISNVRPPLPAHYLNTSNPAAGMTHGHLAAITQLRSPATMARPMVPSGIPNIPAGPHMSGQPVINAAANQQRQTAGRQSVPLQQVLPAGAMNQRPSMASVVAGMPNANANLMHKLITGPAASVRFHQTARNVTGQPAALQQSNMSTVLPPLGDQNPITVSSIQQLSEEEQKQTLGERLYLLVNEMYPALATKLTGMMLGMDLAEILHMLESKESLRAKCEEGISVLKHKQNMSAELSDETHVSTTNGPGQNGDGSVGAGDMNAENKMELKTPVDVMKIDKTN